MRRNWLFAGAISAAALCALSAGLAAPNLATPRLADLPGKASPGSIGVDVELVLAVDISYSMDFDELKLQREGYVEAITSTESSTRSSRACTARSRSRWSNGPASPISASSCPGG
jgi:hypothetical protein